METITATGTATKSPSVFRVPNSRLRNFPSTFGDMDDVYLVTTLLEQNRNEFQALVKSRYEYLESLRNLRNDWISGTSVAPSAVTISQAKGILIDLASWLMMKPGILLPKIIMGPIPTGGIGIEFVVEGKFKLFLNLYDNDSIELEANLFKTGDFIEIDTENNSIEYLIKQAYIILMSI